MFDSKAILGIRLPDGKRVSVSIPSDADWTTWRRAKKILQKDIGRRQFQMEPGKPEKADLDLFRKIQHVDDGAERVELDEAEASYVIAKLSECDVTEQPERNGSEYVVRMKVLGKLFVTHTLRVPTVREMMDYERNRNSLTFGQYGTQEIRINYRAAGDLYDKLAVLNEGYAQAVPIPHKAEAVNVLLQEIRADQEEDSEDPE